MNTTTLIFLRIKLQKTKELPAVALRLWRTRRSTNKKLLILLCYFLNASAFFERFLPTTENAKKNWGIILKNDENAFLTNDNVKIINGSDETPTIKFKDIIGGVPQEVSDLKAFLQDDKIFKDIGAKKPKGILLVGPPGCGKTLIAKALAGEMNAAFFATTASSFMELYVGSGPLKIRELFAKAGKATKKGKKAIIFIDEIDALGKRTSGPFEHSERNNTIIQLLDAMQGFEQNDDITIIAATNRADSLDEALLRAGRFDHIVTVPLPDLQKREAIIKYYLYANNRKVDKKIDIKYYAKNTEGFNCADLNDLVNKAATNAGRNRRKEVSLEDMETSLNELKRLKRIYR